MDITLLPYNPMGVEMAVSLGRPKPPLPEGFMKPDEEGETLALFRKLLQEKGEANSMRRSNVSTVRPSPRLTGG